MWDKYVMSECKTYKIITDLPSSSLSSFISGGLTGVVTQKML